MEHAERLCDRILLMAKGRKIYDGTIPEAKRIMPRRVRIETEDDIGPLREIRDVVAFHEISNHQSTIKDAQANGSAQWELELRESSDPQAILQACFANKI